MTATYAVASRLLLALLPAFFSLYSSAQLSTAFSATPLSGCAPLIVNFTDQSTGNPNQWRWDLGNATTSTLQNPATTYFNPGTYTVKLVIRNAAGNADSLTKTQYITVQAKPVIAFTGTPLTGCIPLPVEFSNQSSAGSGSIQNIQWDFGDGDLSAAPDPSHTYITAGNFNVSLQVTNSFGCSSSITKPQYIKTGAALKAGFTNTLPGNCDLPATISFQNTSTGSGTLSYQWNFGDGNTSTAINPAHTYNAAGAYTVTLIVTNTTGCTDTLIRTNAVTIGIVNAEFVAPGSACVNTGIAFSNASVPNPSSVRWDFGDNTSSVAFNVIKSYSAPGTYNVKMVAQFGNCSDSVTHSITILPVPTAAFTANPLSGCAVPLVVNFSNQSTGAVNYEWDFGDGNTGAGINPQHIYTAFGTYTVRLIATNFEGCSDTLTRTAYIRIQAPEATINNLPYKNCAPLTHTFSANINSNEQVVSYEWDFGDGNTSTATSPTHTFPVGVYNIRLIIVTASGCRDTVTADKGIVSSVKPTANFIAAPRDVCARFPVHFTDLSTLPAGNITAWLWTFGDGGTSTQQNPTHIYEDTGYFNIRLIVWNEGCADTIEFSNYVHIMPPIAAFSVPYTCSAPLIRHFNDQSIGADEWSWDFGDGNTSTVQNPTHTYAAPGIYTVSLTVKNHTTGCDYTKTIPIQLALEHAAFTESARIICRNTPVDFEAQSFRNQDVAAYNWDYGDGSTGTGKKSSHIYTTAGTYTVRLIITDVLGCRDTLIKPLHIRVDGPTAGFNIPAAGTCSMAPALFNDMSTTDGTHAISTWTWNFGDGNTVVFTAPPFIHQYNTAGVYDIRLKVTDSQGCVDSIFRQAAIMISKPVAAFTTADTVSCPGKPVTFSNASSGPSITYQWNFGDATTSTDKDPVHQYNNDGVYAVKLVVVDQYGCSDTLVKTVTIASPVARFAMSDSVSSCPPLIVNFTNTSLNAVSVNWDFGDGTSTQGDNPSHFYSYPGTYPVKLSIVSTGGCTDEIVKNIVVRGPQGSFTYAPLTGCSPLTVTLTATTLNRLSFVWDFNDGNILPTADSVITYTYTLPGNYVPKMILVDAAGCQVPITGIDTIRVKGAIANFGFTSPVLCDNGLVNFSDSSTSNDGITAYEWDFGDGNSSTAQNPAHFYNAPGLYYPKLIVTTLSGCRDTIQKPNPVKIVASPVAAVVQSPNGCAPLTVTYSGNVATDTSTVEWNWNLGNNIFFNGQNPPVQVYTTAAVYPVQLIVTNSSGCRDTVNTNAEAFVVPTVDAGKDTLVCLGSGMPLLATGADNYTWTPSTGLSCTNCPNPVASPVNLTVYQVTGETIHGCKNYDSVIVRVQQPFVMNNSRGDTLCKGESLKLYATGAHSYTWSPSTGLSSTTSPIPTATPSVSTTYRVIGTDDRGCFRDTAFIPVKVYNYPTVEAGQNKTISAGESTVLTPVISNDVITVNWTPTLGIVSNNYPSVTVKPRATTTYFVEAVNAGGCRSNDNLTVAVLCGGANVFIPNTFSPNGDGVNDVFYPRGSGLFRIKSLRIFNRWGEVVYSKNDIMPNDVRAGWDGNYKGVKLSPDVFVYTAEVECENATILTLKGDVALMR